MIFKTPHEILSLNKKERREYMKTGELSALRVKAGRTGSESLFSCDSRQFPRKSGLGGPRLEMTRSHWLARREKKSRAITCVLLALYAICLFRGHVRASGVKAAYNVHATCLQRSDSIISLGFLAVGVEYYNLTLLTNLKRQEHINGTDQRFY
jgi:hypothetical protein